MPLFQHEAMACSSCACAIKGASLCSSALSRSHFFLSRQRVHFVRFETGWDNRMHLQAQSAHWPMAHGWGARQFTKGFCSVHYHICRSTHKQGSVPGSPLFWPSHRVTQ